MKNIVSGLALVLSLMSWSAVAKEQDSMHGQAPMEEQCKAMAVQHGMKGDKLDAWVKKCLEIANEIKNDRAMDEGKHHMDDMNHSNDMRDTEDGDPGMNDDSQ